MVAGVYVAAMAVLGLHLYHGVWSTFQTLGTNNPTQIRFRRPIAAAVAIVLFLGFIAVPISVLTGIVR
jgi:succinate dehydrogenase / fumarate reductase cytochrome b subunit